MNIKIIRDADVPSDLTGGEYSVPNLEIYIDPDLPMRTQRGLVIHAVIENYFRSIEHSKVEEITEFIQESLDQLGED